jgi:DNA-binding transcriptional MerR regulator
MVGGVAERMTIEQLAAATGMTVRNIREHQTRGLLPPPAVERRKGYYDTGHLARLRLISELQREGLNLQAISWLLAHAPADAAEEIARFRKALFAPWGPEEPVRYTTRQLGAVLGPVPAATSRRAEELGIVRRVGKDRWEAPSPRLLEAGRELVALGIPLDAALDVLAKVHQHAGAIAAAFVQLFVDQVWRPFADAGHPPERWTEVREALERLRPVAIDTLLAVFQRTMADAVAERSQTL